IYKQLDVISTLDLAIAVLGIYRVDALPSISSQKNNSSRLIPDNDRCDLYYSKRQKRSPVRWLCDRNRATVFSPILKVLTFCISRCQPKLL
ncbi:MAG TPA: hypothetical protein V6C91_02715, partial [Coleofasciculaceae cyanobacterium]